MAEVNSVGGKYIQNLSINNPGVLDAAAAFRAAPAGVELPSLPWGASRAAPACAAGSMDLAGDRAHLRYPFVTFLLAYRSNGTNWILQRDDVKLLTAGDEEDGSDAGFDGNLNQSMTSLLKAGFITEEDHFAVQRLGFVPVGLPYEPTTHTAAASTTYEASPTGTVRTDCQGIYRELFNAAFQGADVSFKRTGREFNFLLGTPELHPGGFGANIQDGAGFGAPVVAARTSLRRPLLIPPKTAKADGYQIKVQFRNKIAVAPDAGFAVPADGQSVALMVRLVLSGYICDAQGVPADAFEEMAQRV